MKTIVLMLALAATAQAAPTKRELDRALGGFERAPAAADVLRLGAGADHVLIGVAGDGKASRLRRVRAILALQFVPSADAREFLLALLRDQAEATDGASVVEVAAALTALAPHGPEVAAAILPFVTHGAADVRQSAAVALALTRAPSAAAALQLRLTAERDPGVRATVARALQSLPATP